jgi:hypothetical protein
MRNSSIAAEATGAGNPTVRTPSSQVNGNASSRKASVRGRRATASSADEDGLDASNGNLRIVHPEEKPANRPFLPCASQIGNHFAMLRKHFVVKFKFS